MIKILKCSRCGHCWLPRQERKPVACPSCNSRKYRKWKLKTNK